MSNKIQKQEQLELRRIIFPTEEQKFTSINQLLAALAVGIIVRCLNLWKTATTLSC